MAGMFCSIEEAAQRLGRTAEDIKEMIKLGVFREFRDGPNLLLKVDEIEDAARREGIELPIGSPADEVQAPPPLATIPITLKTRPEEVEMEEPEIPDLDSLEPSALDDADLDIPELDSLKDDMPDLELPELAAVGSESEIPVLAADELLSAAKEPPVEKPKTKAKKIRMPKPKKQPRPRPVKVGASTAPGLSFGEWFVRGLRDDSLAAIFVLVILLGLVVATCIAIGYGANYAVENLL